MTGPEQGREYPPETLWQAQELYCVVRLSYAKLATEMGLAESTLKRWGQQYGWAEKRERIAQAQADIRADTILARSQMLKELLENQQPPGRLCGGETGAPGPGTGQGGARGPAWPRPGRMKLARRQINGPAEAAAALREAIEIKLSRLLASPQDVDLKAVNAIKDAMDAVAEFDGQEKKPVGNKGLSAKDAEMIRQKILGGG